MILSDKKIIVTGAASGIGKELLSQLYAKGNEMLAVDIQAEKLAQLQSEFPRLHILPLDLTTDGSCDTIINWVNSNWGKFDVFFSNAGFAVYGNWDQIPSAKTENMFRINVFFHIELAPKLKAKFGDQFQLVITASAMSYWAVPGYAAYAGSKAAIHRWAEGVWVEGNGNWLSLVYPAATATDFFENAGNQIPKAYPVQSVKKAVRSILKGIEAGRRKIFPSTLFRVILVLNRILPVIKPIYCWMENRKLQRWTDSR
jgi:short-subunit dehydrogenase